MARAESATTSTTPPAIANSVFESMRGIGAVNYFGCTLFVVASIMLVGCAM